LVISREHIRSLRSELTDAGVFEPRPLRNVLKFAFLVSVTVAIAVLAFSLPLWWTLALAPVAAVFAIPAGMIGHEANHKSFSKSLRANKIMSHVTYPLFSGLGILHWHEKHHVRHHGHPNVVGVDHDLKLWPIAVTNDQHRRATRFGRWFQRNCQGFAFWPLTFFVVANMRFDSRRVLLRDLRRDGLTPGLAADAACQVAHLLLWVALPAVFVGLGHALLFYFAVWTFAAPMLAMIFAPAHLGQPLVSEQERGWHHQLATTRNLRVPRVVSYFLIGLEYQVEHHLFPKVPHQHLPTARLILRRWCLEHGYPHHEMPYGAALRNTTRFISSAWQLEPGRLAS